MSAEQRADHKIVKLLERGATSTAIKIDFILVAIFDGLCQFLQLDPLPIHSNTRLDTVAAPASSSFTDFDFNISINI